MGWRRRLRVFLSPYRNLPVLQRRKAEFSLLITGLLSGIVAVRLGLKAAAEGLSDLWWIEVLGYPLAFGLVLLLLARGRLEALVNLLALLGFVQCALLFPGTVSRHFFVLNLFSMISFAVLAIRPYQRTVAFTAFPLLATAKGVEELLSSDGTQRPGVAADETVLTLAIFVAVIPLMNFLIMIVDREIRHSERLLDQNVSLKREAGTDRLTGAWNRRHFDQLARRETAEALRTGRPLALVFLDLDWFKAVNDQWGHQAGDEALTEFVRTVMVVLRQGDSMIRWGGDEFVVLCPGVGAGDAPGLGEKILESVRISPLLRSRDLGVSVGIAVWRPGEAIQDLVNRADRLLYLAKESGRNRVCIEGEPS